MTQIKKYAIKKTGVTFDVFDDEIVALNLIDGKYYSLEGTAAVIWQCVQNHYSTTDTVGFLKSIPGAPDAQLSETVNAFLQQLENEGLLVETPDTGTQLQVTFVQLPDAYTEPVLHIFTDMQEVIALDPVHDVSAKGWPLKNDGSTK